MGRRLPSSHTAGDPPIGAAMRSWFGDCANEIRVSAKTSPKTVRLFRTRIVLRRINLPSRQQQAVAGVALTCSVGPRLFLDHRDRAADLPNRSAPHFLSAKAAKMAALPRKINFETMPLERP